MPAAASEALPRNFMCSIRKHYNTTLAVGNEENWSDVKRVLLQTVERSVQNVRIALKEWTIHDTQ